MKKLIYCFLFAINTPFSFGQVELSPELDKFMELESMPEELFENNAYVGWLGINYAGDDWRMINQKILQHNQLLLNQQIRNGKLSNNFYTDKLSRAFKVPKNIDVFDNIASPEIELLFLSDYVDNDQEFLKFIQHPVSFKKYTTANDYFACREYLKANCLEDIQKNTAYLREVIIKNQTLLSRYRELMKESEFTYALFYNDYNALRTLKVTPKASQLFQLNLTDAALDIMDGEVNTGLDKLVLARRWIDLSYKEESMPLTSHLVFYITYSQYLDQLMDALLSTQLLEQYLSDPRLEMIVRPYPENIGKKLNASIIRELKQIFKSIIYPFVRVYNIVPFDHELTEEDEYIALLYFQEKTIMIPAMLLARFQELENEKSNKNWDKVEQLYRLRDKAFLSSSFAMKDVDNSAKDNLLEWYTTFFNQINAKPTEVLAYLNKKYPSIDYYNQYYNFLETLSQRNTERMHFTTPVLEFILRSEVPIDYIPLVHAVVPYSDFDIYWTRLYEQQNYHRLIYLKYLILRDGIASEDIPEFLASMGSLAINTINNLPYEYDQVNNILLTPLPIDNKYLPINIKDARLDNKLIKNFQVTLPVDDRY